MTANPRLLQNSHDDGSSAALKLLLTAICTWEVLYHVVRYLVKLCLRVSPQWLLDDSLLIGSAKNITAHDKQTNGFSNGNQVPLNGSPNGCHERAALLEAKQNLSQRGASYAVSLIHAFYASCRGVLHLYNLRNVSNLDKLLIPSTHAVHGIITPRWAHLQVATTNTVFLSYLLYDLVHILIQYPKLGGADTILHHILFATCSVINGTYGILAFPFGWLVVGELSTIFLNLRWFLLKSGRDKSLLLERANMSFAASFFLTRNVVYTLGMVHLFYVSWKELSMLSEVSGVPVGWLLLTVGCIFLGWGLNVVWGYKILKMVRKKNGNKKK
ncbi:hypothetical protein HJC23_013370 [Cyclotella cryptica]|uniref:TLC domain-containing protein n=1 Tax=Cyclotella cryptica TaxID=29204 RepID=A0ABD3PC10_9STRA